jgi:hypothetical protein
VTKVALEGSQRKFTLEIQNGMYAKNSDLNQTLSKSKKGVEDKKAGI